MTSFSQVQVLVERGMEWPGAAALRGALLGVAGEGPTESFGPESARRREGELFVVFFYYERSKLEAFCPISKEACRGQLILRDFREASLEELVLVLGAYRLGAGWPRDGSPGVWGRALCPS